MSANVESSGFVGRLLGNRWTVGETLGSGSFGVVHAGVDTQTGEAVAIKLLHPQFIHHGETIARFWNEAEALRRLNHPNVLTFRSVGVSDDGVPFLVTELLTGETLKDLLSREGALPPERAMRLLGPAAHALHHAHQLGIVHRDLKPENIYRVRREGMGTTKILDFGMAKLLDTAPGRKLSQTGVMIGTMAYSPPEQMQGVADIDHRADQFGFAALMFEALTGQRPFPQSQPFQLFSAVTSGARPKASDLRPELGAGVDDVLGRALEADRERRFGNVEEFYLELTKALTSPGYRSMPKTFVEAGPNKLPSAELPLLRASDLATARAEARPAAASDAPDPRFSTMQSGVPPRTGTTTLAEGSVARSDPPLNTTLASGNLAAGSMVSAPPAPTPSPAPVSQPPASHERAVTSGELPPPAPSPAPSDEAASSGSNRVWVFLAIALVVLAVAVVIWRVVVVR